MSTLASRSDPASEPRSSTRRRVRLLLVPLMAGSLLPTPALGDGPSRERAIDTREWLLSSPARVFLSGSAEAALLAQNGLLEVGSIAPRSVFQEADRSAASGGPDIRINEVGGSVSPSEGSSPQCNTQTEVGLASAGDHVVAAWVDGRQCQKLIQSWAADQTQDAGPARQPAVTGVSLSGYGFSSDGGKTWTDGGELTPPLGGNLFGNPALAAGVDGEFYYATLTGDPACCQIGVAASSDGGRSWSPAVHVSRDRQAGALQDKPWIAVDRSEDSSHRGTVYVTWTEWAPSGTAMNAVLFARSPDGGQTFSPPLELSVPEEGGVSGTTGMGTQVAVGPAGEIYVVWVDASRSRVWIVRSSDGGISFTPPTRIMNTAPAGHDTACFPGAPTRPVLNGDIRIPYNLPSLAVDTSGSSDPTANDFNPNRGRVYVAVTHDDDAAISGWPTSLDEADIAFTYSTDGGSTWQNTDRPDLHTDSVPTVIINDDQTETDQFNPQVRVDDRGRVAVSWYDRRVSVPQQANWDITLFSAVSTDGGESFGQNVQVGDTPFAPPRTNPNGNWLGGCYMGLYNGMAAGRGEFLVAWGDNRDGTHLTPDLNVYLDRISLG